MAHQAQRRRIGVGALVASDQRGPARRRLDRFDVEPQPVELVADQLSTGRFVTRLGGAIVDALVSNELLEKLDGLVRQRFDCGSHSRSLGLQAARSYAESAERVCRHGTRKVELLVAVAPHESIEQAPDARV